jgi:hypothetical protein
MILLLVSFLFRLSPGGQVDLSSFEDFSIDFFFSDLVSFEKVPSPLLMGRPFFPRQLFLYITKEMFEGANIFRFALDRHIAV